MQPKHSAVGRFPTENASKYLQQLCKHFAHKVEVSYDTTQGQAALPPGPCRLHAETDALRVEICANDQDGLTLARHIIDSHLERFAFREDFKGMDWQ